ncbi:MAG: hypothetical protein AMJ58_10205 [Gammaproteobacteria bacterium SG8_30]|jgi:pimeloyl-ACP methyl ester carboxylesterase|nr:MAG: hypothetical protein AMJ58_10205 [Gammaproteobacteria bacterium SG8_30]
MRSVVYLLIAAAAVYASLCAMLFLTQRSHIYFPTGESGTANAEAVSIESHGERIKVWSVARPGRNALVYFGGNAEDVAWSIDPLSAAFPDRSLYLVNYRGYGGSSGRPSERGLKADALVVHDHVARSHADIAVMGRSLGSGIAVSLAAARRVQRLVLVTPYDSLVEVARKYYRYLPVSLLLRDRYDSAALAPSVSAPVLLVVAAEDEIIPRERSEALAAAFAPGQATVTVIAGAGHNSLDLSPDYLRTVQRFLDSP